MAATDGQGPEGQEQTPVQARGWAIPILLAVAVIAVILGGVALVSNAGKTHHKAQTATYVVPKGTSQKIYEGKTINIMPTTVALKVGDSLIIRNDDVETVTVGPFTVRAGETLTQRFQRPQTLIGECALSGSGSIRIVVT